MEKSKVKILAGDLFVRFQEHDVLALGSQVAYNLLLALFPFLIFMMTVIGFSDVKSEDILVNLRQVLPVQAYDLIKHTIVEVVDTRRGHLLSFSLIATLWSASSGFNAIIKGLNKSYREEERRGFIKLQLLSLIFTVGFTFTIFAVFFFLIFGEINGKIIASSLGLSQVFYYLWDWLRYLAMIVVMVLVFAVLYRYTPIKKHRWKEVLPGALFTALAWVIASVCFSLYVNNFSAYSKIYGSIGAVIILMLWLFITSVVIIFGGEINAVIMEYKTQKR
ncbi:MAG: YihY/virulence factor BrkB family protein [Bacillota bacterium]|nr:YihY/virulence factor BrkB family protein [Bacillota bacterium]